ASQFQRLCYAVFRLRVVLRVQVRTADVDFAHFHVLGDPCDANLHEALREGSVGDLQVTVDVLLRAVIRMSGGGLLLPRQDLAEGITSLGVVGSGTRDNHPVAVRYRCWLMPNLREVGVM